MSRSEDLLMLISHYDNSKKQFIYKTENPGLTLKLCR